MMETQRLRNLTTGRLHTEIGHIYQDLEFITGIEGIMTHMIPNIMRAVEPWLRKKVTESEYWNDEYEPNHSGEYPLDTMDDIERQEMLIKYKEQSNPLLAKDVLVVINQQ